MSDAGSRARAILSNLSVEPVRRYARVGYKPIRTGRNSPAGRRSLDERNMFMQVFLYTVSEGVWVADTTVDID
jgi:hypothetical protein